MDDLAGKIASILHVDPNAVEISAWQAEAINRLPSNEVARILQKDFQLASDGSARSRIFEAILKLSGFDRVGFLLELYDASESWRAVCCTALSRFADQRAVDKLCSVLLTEPDSDLRYTAAESLAVVGNETALEALDYAAEHDRGVDYEGFPIASIAAEASRKIRAQLRRVGPETDDLASKVVAVLHADPDATSISP